MTYEAFALTAGIAFSMAFVGFAFGLAYFAALRQTAALFASGSGWLAPSALTVGRIGAITLVLTAAAKLGALPLLAAFLGFLLARAVALRLVRGPR